jgi:hypothetical protein
VWFPYIDRLTGLNVYPSQYGYKVKSVSTTLLPVFNHISLNVEIMCIWKRIKLSEPQADLELFFAEILQHRHSLVGLFSAGRFVLLWNGDVKHVVWVWYADKGFGYGMQTWGLGVVCKPCHCFHRLISVFLLENTSFFWLEEGGCPLTPCSYGHDYPKSLIYYNQSFDTFGRCRQVSM